MLFHSPRVPVPSIQRVIYGRKLVFSRVGAAAVDLIIVVTANNMELVSEISAVSLKHSYHSRPIDPSYHMTTPSKFLTAYLDRNSGGVRSRSSKRETCMNRRRNCGLSELRRERPEKKASGGHNGGVG